MDSFWGILIEIALFTLLGVLYYFYQRKKIIHYESHKGPLVMGYILQSFLVERKDDPSAKMDPIIEALDDYIQNKSPIPPTILLKSYAQDPNCSPELKEVILAGLQELEDGKE